MRGGEERREWKSCTMLLPAEISWALVGKDVALGLGFVGPPQKISVGIIALWRVVLVY